MTSNNPSTPDESLRPPVPQANHRNTDQALRDGDGRDVERVLRDGHGRDVEWVWGDADHRDVERVLRDAGWMPCGAGDWAIALRAPDGRAAARISPFDPVAPYTVALYREAAYTGQVPRLFAHRRLVGGGDLQIMEWLEPVDANEAAEFHRALAAREPEVAELADVVWRVHQRGRRELPWFAPKLDDNPDNIMRNADGRLVAADLFGADGPRLYAAVVDDPQLVVTTIPEPERRFMTEIPLTNTGPWPPDVREAMRKNLTTADTANQV